MSSSVYVDKKEKYILALGEDPKIRDQIKDHKDQVALH